MSVPYARNNGQFIMFSVFLAIVNISLFVSRAIEYRNFKNWDGSTNFWIIFARASGTSFVNLIIWTILSILNLSLIHQYNFSYTFIFTGQCLNFTSMFILVLILRHSITKLRQIGLATNLILDRHIYFHKVTGRLVLVYSLLHTAMHIGNICK